MHTGVSYTEVRPLPVQGWRTPLEEETRAVRPLSGILTSPCSSLYNYGLDNNHFERFILGLKLALSFAREKKPPSEST